MLSGHLNPSVARPAACVHCVLGGIWGDRANGFIAPVTGRDSEELRGATVREGMTESWEGVREAGTGLDMKAAFRATGPAWLLEGARGCTSDPRPHPWAFRSVTVCLGAFFFIAAVTNYHKFSRFVHTDLIFYSPGGQESDMHLPGPK